MIDSIEDAIEYAEAAVLADRGEPLGATENMREFVSHLRFAALAPVPADTLVERLTYLSRLLSSLGMRENARDVIQWTLRHMELVEADRTTFPPAAWNEIAVQLALHGELEEARLVLTYALRKARDTSPGAAAVSQDVIILTNLSVISLRSHNVEYAESWSDRALMALHGEPDHPQEVSLAVTLASVRVSIAKERGDKERLSAAVDELGACTRRLLERRGEGQPEVLSALVTLADAKLVLAHAAGAVGEIRRVLSTLERVAQKTMATFGARNPQALFAQANLAGAQFELARSLRSQDSPQTHVENAVESLESAVQLIFAALGEHHPQSLVVSDNFVTARDDSVAVVGLRENIDKTYRPRDNERRNQAKSEAIRREKKLIRIIAFAGASYFMGPLDRYKPVLEDRLSMGVKAKVIISNPWNSAATFFLAGEAPSVRDVEAAMRNIEDGDYMQTFKPVITSYRRLRSEYADRIQLRIAPMDIPGTSLLTSEVGFFEPYMTADPRDRTRRGLKTFEIEFSQISHFYEVESWAFEEYWTISNTVEEYEASEDVFKSLLRQRLETLWGAMSDRST